MRTLLLAAIAALPAFAASADTWWTYADRPDCQNPVLWISEASNEMDRPDFFCSIKDKAARAGVTTYTAECSTDLPSVEMFTVTVVPRGSGLAEITWQGFDTDIYRLCPTDENAIM